MTDKDISIKFIKDFVATYLNGDIDNLLDYPLSKLKQDRKFGCPGRTFDCDDTEIIRHIYIALYGDVWPNLTLDSLKSYDFRGDTLNTYNTMFGRPTDLTVHPGLDRFDVTDSLRQKVATFRVRYSHIGNMVVLPNLKVDGKSINTYRGCHAQWRDFFDRFIIALHDIMTNADVQDDGLATLIEANKIFFEDYKGEDSFKKIVDGLMLNDYVDENYTPLRITKGLFFWKKGLSSEEYEDEATKYIDFANRVIDNRTRLMVDKLKTLCL